MSSACRSGEMPRSPTRTSTGSPGTRRIRTKVSRMMPRKVGTTSPTRVRTKRIMGYCAPKRRGGENTPSPPPGKTCVLLLDVDAFEQVGAEGGDPVAKHRLLHRDVCQRKARGHT